MSSRASTIDVGQLTDVFESCRKSLRSFLFRMTSSKEETDDLVQEVYLKAHQSIKTFKGESSLKTWLFSIGANLAKDFLRAKKRWPDNVTDICRGAALANPEFLNDMMEVRTTSPQGAFEIKEHVSFCFSCISRSVPLEQQLVLLLKEVYAFKVAEIAEIVGHTEAMVKYYLHNARSRMIEIFDGRCSLINKEGACHQCSELNGIFNPKQDFHEEAVKLSMVRDAAGGDKEHLLNLRMKLVEAIDPFDSPASDLQLLHMQHNRRVMDRFLGEDPA